MTVTSNANLRETRNVYFSFEFTRGIGLTLTARGLIIFNPFLRHGMHGNVIECSISVDVSHYCTMLNNRQAREDFARSLSVSSRESRLYQVAQEYGFLTVYRVPCGIPFSSLKSFRGGLILTRL